MRASTLILSIGFSNLELEINFSIIFAKLPHILMRLLVLRNVKLYRLNRQY